MAVQRLGIAAVLCIGLGVVCARATDVVEPFAVAVPVTAGTSSSALKKAPQAKISSKEQEEASDPEEGAADALQTEPGTVETVDNGMLGALSEDHSEALALEEEYLPLDLPPTGGDEPSSAGVTSGGEGEAHESPAVETVLGLEPPSGGAYFVHAEILGIPNGEGMVSASLCTEKNFTKSGCRTMRVPAREGRVSITFDGVSPGVYAVQVHHDQNANGKMDFTFLGLPKEPYGFSRDAKPMLAPPKFKKASFEVADSDVSLVINLQNT